MFLFHFGSRTFICASTFFVFVCSDNSFALGHLWHALALVCCVFSCHTFVFRVSCAFCLIHGHRAFPGDMDGATVSVLSLKQLITAPLLIVNELCHRFRIPLSSASSVPLNTPPDLENPSGSPIPERGSCGAKCRWCDLPCGRAKPGHTGHSYVVTHIVIGVMDNSLDEWSLVHSVESSWDKSSPPLQFRPESAPLQRESLPQGPRLVSPFQVSDLRPVATSSIGCSGQSSAQLHPGIPRISDLSHGCQFLPPQQLPIDSIRIIPGSNPLQIPAQNLPVIQSWTTLQQNA